MRYIIMLAIALNVAGILVTVNRNNAQAVQSSTTNQWHTYRLYEDGSYRGELLTGETVTGCLADGICQD
jgi:hypothetical protein